MRTWPSLRSASIARAASAEAAGTGVKRELLGAAVAVLVLRERGELPEQALGGVGLVRPGLLGDVGAQRLDLADRDLVACVFPPHGRLMATTAGGDPKPPFPRCG